MKEQSIEVEKYSSEIKFGETVTLSLIPIQRRRSIACRPFKMNIGYEAKTEDSIINGNQMKRMFRLSKSFFNRSFLQIIVAGLFLVFLIYFIRNEHIDISHVKSTLEKANPIWISSGIVVTVTYLCLQGALYIFSFRSIGIAIDFKSALTLFLKRNFISTFLPAGSFTSLAFFSDELTKYKLQKAQVYYGSFLFALASMISVVLISFPVIVSLFFHHHARAIDLYGVLLLSVLVILFIYTGYGLIKKKGFAFAIMNRISPRFTTQIAELNSVQ